MQKPKKMLQKFCQQSSLSTDYYTTRGVRHVGHGGNASECIFCVFISLSTLNKDKYRTTSFLFVLTQPRVYVVSQSAYRDLCTNIDKINVPITIHAHSNSLCWYLISLPWCWIVSLWRPRASSIRSISALNTTTNSCCLLTLVFSRKSLMVS